MLKVRDATKLSPKLAPRSHFATSSPIPSHLPVPPVFNPPPPPSFHTNRWEAGNCRFGDRCNFAHGDTELRNLPPRSPTGGGAPPPGGRGRGGYRDDYGPPRGGSSAPPRGGGGGRGGPPRGGPLDARAAAAGINGMDREAWIASGCPVQGPKGWTQYKAEDGEKYYHNSISQETTWETPQDWPNAP